MDWYFHCQEGPPCLIQFCIAVGLLILGWLLLSNSGPSLPSQVCKKSSITADTTSIRSKRGLDSDSDEDGNLFGRKREPSFTSGKLLSSTQPPPASKGERSRDIFADLNSQIPPAVKSSVGVENVRAMPNPTRTGIPSTSRSQNSSSNLFASDTDEDEGDLFSSKPLSSAKSKSQNSKVKSELEQSTRASSGLFSSDEDGALFSTTTVNTHGVVNSGEDHEQKEEPPPLPKPAGKKVPVGGINIFGSAITSAIHQQQSSESEPSYDEGHNRRSSRNSSVSLSKPEPPPFQGTVPKTNNTGKYSGGGDGLFDDDEEEDLFGSMVKKPVTASCETKSGQKESLLPVSSDCIKKPDEEGTLFGNEAAGDTVSNKNVIKSTGLFSDDDDDDLFGIPAKVEKRPNTLPVSPSTGGSSSTKKPLETNSLVVSNAKDDGQFHSAPAVNSAVSQGIQKSSEPVKVPNLPKTLSNSLFSSPSDDDDLFSPSNTFEATKSTSAFITEPPPLPPPSASKSGYGISGSPTYQDNLFPSTSSSLSQANKEPSITYQISDNKLVKVKAEQKAKGSLSSNNCSSPSDDNDLFSSPSQTTYEDVTATQESKGSVESIKTFTDTTVKSESVTPDFTNNTSSQKSESEHGILISPDDDLFMPKTKPKVNLIIEGTKPSMPSKSEMSPEKSDMLTSSDNSGGDIFSDAVSKTLLSNTTALKGYKKEANVLEVSDDEDIFATTEREAKPKLFENVKDDEDIFSVRVTQSQHQKDPVTTEVTRSDIQVNIASEKVVRERESPPMLPSEAESSSTPQTSESELASASQPEKPTQVVKKPPIGGVALFGGAELAARGDRQKSVLNSEKTKGEEVHEERNKSAPEIEKTVLKEEDINSISKSNVFDGESDDDDFFSIRQVKSERSSSLFSRRSPPPLPTEAEEKSTEVAKKPPVGGVALYIGAAVTAQFDKRKSMLSPEKTKSKEVQEVSSQESESPLSHIQGPQPADTKLLGGEIYSLGESELLLNKSSKTKDSNDSARERKELKTGKTDDIGTLEKESQETKPHKKPPIGGVSVFGGGGIRGSELLAKVQQRKSMLAPESESDDDGPTFNSPATSPTQKESTTIPKKNVTPVNPISPVSPLSPVFGSEPLMPKPGGQEKSMSFDNPTTTSTTLQSLNKSRVRGSQQRRPPSRAHRRGGLGEINPSILPNDLTGIESTPPPPPQSVGSSSLKQISPSPTNVSQLEQSVSPKRKRLSEIDEGKGVAVNASSALANKTNEVDSMFIENTAEDDIFGNTTITKDTNIVENEEKSAKISAKEESKSSVALKDKSEDVRNDLFGNSISALNSSKISNSKGSSNSLFGGNDSDDEDLFGQTKPKSSLLKTSGSAAVQNSVIKSVIKPPPTHSLFEDDDDDIFSSASKVEKAATSAPRKVSTAKPKNNLKPSSEPFEDPLFSNLK